MDERPQNHQTSRLVRVRRILLLLALIASPLACCGGLQALDMISPPIVLPPPLDFVLNLFEAGARVENRTDETLYVTAITTTYGEPRVIAQPGLRQRDLPVRPDRSVVLTYDSADAPLAGIVVCRSSEDCRLLAGDYADTYFVDAYETLPELEGGWLSAVQSAPEYGVGTFLFPICGLLPVILWLIWLSAGWLEKKRAADGARESDL